MNDLLSLVLVMVSLVLVIGVTHLVQGLTGLLRVDGGVRRDPLPSSYGLLRFTLRERSFPV